MRKIVASLKYGRVWGKLLWIWIGVILFGVVLLLCGCVLKGDSLEDRLGKIGCIAYGVFSIGLGGYFLIKNAYANAQIKKWTKDGVCVSVYARGIANPVNTPKDHGRCKLWIEFVYEGKKRILHTAAEDTVFAQFSDRFIEIIYSPKYDQAVIPAQKDNKK